MDDVKKAKKQLIEELNELSNSLLVMSFFVACCGFASSCLYLKKQR